MTVLLTWTFGRDWERKRFFQQLGKWFRRSNSSKGKMATNPDFKDLLQELSDAKASFLIVGAHAVMFYTAPRYTKDLDIWVEANRENAKKVYKALKQFGAPLTELTISDLSSPETIFQIGIEPNRIDILTHLKSLDFAKAWKNRKSTTYDGVPIHILGLEDLILNKQAVGRDQDLLDLKNLARPKTKKPT